MTPNIEVGFFNLLSAESFFFLPEKDETLMLFDKLPIPRFFFFFSDLSDRADRAVMVSLAQLTKIIESVRLRILSITDSRFV